MDRIISCAGPWKSSGDWWMGPEKAESWSREEWDIEMTDGSIYRVFWDNNEKNWFLEGIYD
jgi:protein ImuB